MEEMLKGALEWFCDEKRGKLTICSQTRSQVITLLHIMIRVPQLVFHTRFGKVLWGKIPEDVAESALGITDFSQLCFSDTKHSRIFHTKYICNVYCINTHLSPFKKQCQTRGC